MSPERRKAGNPGSKPDFDPQLSFLTPEDALMVVLMRRFVAEASRLYETKTGQSPEEAITIRSPKDAYDFLRLDMEHLGQEQLHTINLNTRNRIIATHMIYQGTVNTTPVRLAELFRPAIIDNANAIIVAHNHPTGDPSPSPDDVKLTEELVATGKLLGIDVLDHIVVGRGKFVSLKERGLGFS